MSGAVFPRSGRFRRSVPGRHDHIKLNQAARLHLFGCKHAPERHGGLSKPMEHGPAVEGGTVSTRFVHQRDQAFDRLRDGGAIFARLGIAQPLFHAKGQTIDARQNLTKIAGARHPFAR